MILGHEVVGTVSRPAADGSGPDRGVRVAVHPASPGPGDGSRYPRSRPNLSPGVSYLGSAAQVPHRDGAFARSTVLPSRMLRTLPADLSFELAALIEPASVAWHAVGRAHLVAGRRVMVIGAGPIGQLIMAVARRAGAAAVIAVDLHDHPLELARRLGATQVLGAGEATAIAAADADVVFECSGSSHGLASAVRGATRGGEVIMVGMLPAGEQPALISLAITRELELKGSFRFNDEIDDVIAALADGSLPVAEVVTRRFPLRDTVAAFELAADPTRSGKVLIDFRPDPAPVAEAVPSHQGG